MIKKLIFIIFSIIANKAISQTNPYELNSEFDSEVKLSNIKEILIWQSKDSLLNNKEKFCVLKYDKQHRIIEETYIEDGKYKPYQKYSYPSKNKIKMKFNADNQYWITYDYSLLDNGLIDYIDITGGDCYKIKVKYEYKNKQLISKEIDDKSCEPGLIGEGKKNFEYNQNGQLLRTYEIKTKNIETFIYDSLGNLFKYISHGENPEWEKHTKTYNYSNGKLTKVIEEFYNSGQKDNLFKNETIYEYDKNGLKTLMKYHSVNENKWNYNYYTYVFK